MSDSGPTYATRNNSGPTYAKIIGANIYGRYPYRVGLNTLIGETFNADPKHGPGGLYYCELKNICGWFHHGDQLCIVRPVGQIVAVGDKFKTDRLEIESIMDLCEVSTWKFLVEHGVEVNGMLQWAANKGQLEIVKFLVENGADDDHALLLAAEGGQLEIVKFLVENGADVHADDSYALWCAAQNGNDKMVKFLVDQGADVHARGDSALQKAAWNGHLEIVKFLIDNGADVRADDSLALRWAAQRGHLEIVKFLVEYGAPVPYDDCLRCGHVEVMKYFVEKGADVHDKNLLGLLVCAGHLQAVEYVAKQQGFVVHEGVGMIFNGKLLEWKMMNSALV